MFSIPILLGTVRRGRKSPRVAQFIADRLRKSARVETEILDPDPLHLPLMEERLRFLDNPPDGLPAFAKKIADADGLVIVTPEYNHGYPGTLKTVIDYLGPEFKRKPVGVITVSDGPFGGLDCLQQIRTVLLAIGAQPIPAAFPITNVGKSFDDDGHPTDTTYEGRADRFLDELLFWVETVAPKNAEAKAAAGAR